MPFTKSQNKPFRIKKQETNENIPYLKNNKKMAILRNDENIFTSRIVEQTKVNQLLDDQNIKFIGILCTNNNIVNPNDYGIVIDQIIMGDIMVEYDEFEKINKNPLVLNDNGNILAVMRPNNQKLNDGKQGFEYMGLLAYNRITFEKTSIVDPNDIRKVIGRVDSEVDIFVDQDKFLGLIKSVN